MDNIVIRYLDHPKLEDPIFIEGLPGIGNVGKLAAEHLKDELKGVKFAEIFSKYFPPQVLVQLYDMNAVYLMGETSGYFVDPKSAQAVLEVLTKYLGIEISFNELETKAKQIDQITSKLKDIEAAPETPDKREDLGYIG